MTETREARMPALPGGLAPYRKTPVFTAATVPDGITADHSTKPGVWALIHVVRGRCATRSSNGERSMN